MQKIFRYIRKYDMIHSGDQILAGVSGGADSVCLLLALLEYRKQVDFSVSVVHVEHGIRGEESRRDADFVRELCDQWDVPFLLVSFDIPAMSREQKLSLEETARQARYQAFEQVRGELGADRIAVAHNRRDQAETMLWHMARGCGLDGACGIRPVRGRIIRPLLDCDRPEIEDWLRERGISWREDSTNRDTAYTRNYIRNELLPMMEAGLNAGTVNHLAALGEELRQTEAYLENQVRDAAARMVHWSGEKKVRFAYETEEPEAGVSGSDIWIDLTEFQKEIPFLQGRIVRYCLTLAGCGGRDVTRKHIGEICALSRGQSGRRVMLPGDWMAWREFDRIRIRKCDEQHEAGRTSDRSQRAGRMSDGLQKAGRMSDRPQRADGMSDGLQKAGRTSDRPQRADRMSDELQKAAEDAGNDRGAGWKSLQDREIPEASAESGTLLRIPGVTQTPFGTFETRIFFHENQKIPEKKYTKWLDYDKMSEDGGKRSRLVCETSADSGDRPADDAIWIRGGLPGDGTIRIKGGLPEDDTIRIKGGLPEDDTIRIRGGLPEDDIIRIRGRQPGDFLVINREGGRKKLKSYFMEEKIPAQDRDRVGLVTCGQEILWVVGHRIGEAWKVKPGTKQILEIRFLASDASELK